MKVLSFVNVIVNMLVVKFLKNIFEEIIVQKLHTYLDISLSGKYIGIEVNFRCNDIANSSFFCITVAYTFSLLNRNVIHVLQNYSHMTCCVSFREMVSYWELNPGFCMHYASTVPLSSVCSPLSFFVLLVCTEQLFSDFLHGVPFP